MIRELDKTGSGIRERAGVRDYGIIPCLSMCGRGEREAEREKEREREGAGGAPTLN